MQKSQQFELDDGSILDVPEQERAAFDAEVQAKGRSVTPVQGFILDDGEPVHVPLNEVEEFKQTAQEKGRTFEAFTPIYAGGEFLDVPDGERSEFYRAYVKSEKPEIVKEREANTRKVIGDIVQDDEILTRWANRDKVSAGAANVFRAVPQAVASVPGYALKGGAFTTRFLDPILGEASKSMRDVVNGVADKLDAFAQEKFGFRDETGKLTGDLDVTAGPAALKSVVESYMLSKVPFAGVALSGKIAALVEPVLKSAKAADTVAKLAVPSVQSLLYGAAQAEDTAAKAEEAGKGTAQQIALGAATGTAQTVLENVTKIFGLQRVMGNKTLQETIQKAVLYAALDAVGEGVTEGAQQLSTGAIEKLAKIDAKTWGEIGKDALASTAVGLLAGGASASANLAALVAGGGAATRVQPSVQDAQQEPVEPQQEPVEPQQDAQEQQDAGDGQDAAAAAAATQGMELPEGVSLIGGDAPAVDVENGVRLIGAEENAQGEIVGARVQLPGGSVFTTIEPGILAMAQYYYKDNVLFPQPDGQQQPRAPEALAETVRIEASQRAGFNLRNGMTVDVYAGRSAKPYRADVVSILDGSTVRVKIRRSVRASKNNRAGYADVDIAQVKQLPSVKARLERTALEKDLTPEQKKIVNANEQAFRQLIQSDDTFIDQRKLDAARGIGGRRGAIMEKNVFDQAFFEASRALGVPLDNHIQRSEALGALQAFYAAREGAATQEAQQEQQSAQAVLESGRDWLRSAPDFQLDSMTIDEQKREQARLARQAEAERIRSVIADRMAAPIEGTAGVLNADLFGEGDTPLFFTPPQTQQPMPKSWEDAVRRGLVQDDTGDEAPFNVAPEQLDAMDRDYLAAVKRGDMDAAQKMVDAAAKLAGYTIGPVWHGTDGGVFTVFKPAKDGVFTTQNRASAEAYGQRVIKGFLKSDNMITLTPDVLADLDNEIGGFTEEDYRNNFASFYDSSNGFMRKRIVEIIRSKGYDGYIIPNDVHWTNKPESDVADAIVVFNAEQIKSADPVTRDDAGNVIPLSQRFDMRSEDIRFNVAPDQLDAMDEKYMAAVKRGDMDAAQKMVDAAAKLAGYIVKTFHGSKHTGITQFESGLHGIFSSPDESVAVAYSNRLNDSPGRVYNLYLLTNRIKRVDYNGREWFEHPSDFENADTYSQAIVAKKEGYDSVLFTNVGYNQHQEWVVFDASQIKSADPVTYDDQGNIVPLSQRFDMRSDDLRFNVAPGGAATGEKSFYMREGAGKTPAEDVDGISMMDSVSESPLGSVYGADSAGADDGSDATFVRDARSGRVFVGMDFRDAVKMYSDLTGGDLPKIVKQIARNPQAMGVFRAREGRTTGPIELVAALFGLVDNVDRERIAKEVEKDGFDSGEEFAEIERRMKALADERAKGKMKRPLKVMVHELSHMVDMLPDGVISRGNILGHIAALKKYRKFTVAAGLGMADEVTRAKKQELREQALKDVKELMGEARVIIEEIKREVPEYREIPVTADALRGLVGVDQKALSPELVEWFARQDTAVKKEILKRALKGIVDERAARFAQREIVGVRTETVRTERQVGGYTERDVNRRYAELLREATEELRLIERKAIVREAARVVPMWRGTGVTEDYFMSQPNEMFAELYGMFLADPQWLRQNAPTTFRAFAGWLDARPEFARAYEAFARAKESGEQQAQHVINLREAMTVENENRLAALMHKMQEPTRQTAWQSIMFGFHRKMYPVYAAINSTYKQELEKAVTDAQRKDVRQQKLERIRAVKMTSHRAGAVNMLMSDLTGRVNRVLESINASWEMLGEMAFHQRNAYDVQGRVGVAWGWEPRDSMRRLEEMQADMGAERWAKMQDAWQYFRGAYEANVLDNPMVVKMYGREFVDSLRKNIWYVTFKHVPTRSEMDKLEEMIKKGDDRGVIDLMGDHVQNKFGSAGAKIYALKGSLKPVANPMIATMEKASSIIDSAVKNNLKLEFVKMAKINPGIKFWELKPLYDPGAKRPRFNEVNRANEGTVYYVDNGDLKAFVCDKYVAEAFNNSSETLQSIGWLMKFNRSMSAMYTSLNYAFYEPAYMKDKQAAVANVKGMYRAPVVGLLPFGEFIGLFNRYMSPEMQRLIPKPLLNDSMLEYHEPVARRAAIIIRDNSYDAVMEQATVLKSQGNTVRADFLKRAVFLARYAQQNGLLMNMGDVVSGFDGTSDMSRLMRRKGLRALDYDSHRNMIGQMMDWVWGLGAIRENTTKLATLSFLKSKGYNDAEVTRIVTEWGGSPDFSERGFYTNVVEFVLGSFLNARKEAVLRSATAAADHPADYLTKKALYTVAPTILQWVLFSGAAKFVLDAMWDDDEKKDSSLYSFVEWCYAKMRFAASYHMKNFMCIPLPVDGLGKCAVIMTIPLDETEQLVRNTIWSGLDEIAEKGFDVPAGKDKSPVKNLANSMFQSFIPALDVNAPLMKVVWMTLNGFVLGNNTTRSFNNSKVWNDDEMETRFSRPEAVTKLFKELWSVSGGAGMVYRDKVDPVLRDTLPLERAINLPFIQPYFGRFVRVVDSGIDEMESKLKALQESNRAPHQLQARADFARFVKEGANMSQDIQARIVDSPYYREEFEKLYATHHRDKSGVPFDSVRIEDPAILKRWESIVNLNRDLFEVRAPSENTRDSSILSILEPSRSVRLQTEK